MNTTFNFSEDDLRIFLYDYVDSFLAKEIHNINKGTTSIEALVTDCKYCPYRNDCKNDVCTGSNDFCEDFLLRKIALQKNDVILSTDSIDRLYDSLRYCYYLYKDIDSGKKAIIRTLSDKHCHETAQGIAQAISASLTYDRVCTPYDVANPHYSLYYRKNN